MKPGFFQQIDRGARQLFPFAISVFLVIVSVIPMPIPGYALVAPAFGVMAVYYWAIHRPDLLPAIAVFLLGLLQDILTGAPTGVNTLVLLLVYGVMRNQRKPFLGKPFAVMWFGFVIVAPCALAVQWLVESAALGRVIPPATPGVQLLLTLVLYPCVAWVFASGQRTFLRPDED